MASPVVYTNAFQTQLSENISDVSTTIAVGDTSGFTASGYVAITRGKVDEIVQYAAIDQNILTGCTRGAESTVAVEHYIGEIIAQVELIVGTETPTTMGALINSASNATPNNTDFVATAESGGILKKISWTNVKAFLKTYFDTFYVLLTRNVNTTSPITGGGNLSADRTIAFDQTVTLGNNARVAVSKNSGATVGTRRRINLIEGSNVTLTIADDSGNEEVDVTIAASSGGVSDGNKGDITVSGGGTVWDINAGAVGTAELATGIGIQAANNGLAVQDTGADHTLLIRPTEDYTANRTLSLVIGNVSRTLTMTADASIGGTNTGDQTITLTGDVTGSGTGSFAATIGARAVTVGKFQAVTASRILGRISATNGDMEEIRLQGGIEFDVPSTAIQVSAFTGDVTKAAGGTTLTITGLDATKIGTGVVSNTEFGYLDGVTSDIQPQLNSKVSSVGASAPIASSGGTTPTISWNPTGSVEFNQQQGLQFRLENRTSDPGSPAVGQLWFRTDL